MSIRKKTWQDNKVKIAFKHSESFAAVYDAIENFDDDYDITIVVDLDYEQDVHMFHQRIEAINYSIGYGAYDDVNVWVMSSHQMMIVTMKVMMMEALFNTMITITQCCMFKGLITCRSLQTS